MMKTKEQERTKTFAVKVPLNLLERVKDRADFIPLAVVTRRLFERFAKGEIDLGIEKNQ